VVGLGSCTTALWLTLKALGIGPGDEVITTPCTAFPTAEAVGLAGASVVFADIRPGTYEIDPDAVSAAITPKTRAIIPVHLYGIPCNLQPLVRLARDFEIRIVEDCAQAQGARYGEERVGNLGDAACFSFFPSKPLGGAGDGGAMIARDPDVRARVRALANHGRVSKFEHVEEGCNSRLDALQAAVLLAKLTVLDERNALRRRVAGWYGEDFRAVEEVRLPALHPQAEPVWHVYPIRVPRRDALQSFLAERGIRTGLHYPCPLHRQPALARLGLEPGSLPEAEAAFAEELSLPMFPTMTREQVRTVTRAVRDFFVAAT
jgi:dTDP-4-amino-4,6-dideoxygalactose transaminase